MVPHADQAGIAFSLSHRLAADQPLGPLRTRQGPLPGLRPAAWCGRAASGGRSLVGRGRPDLAQRQRPQNRHARVDRRPADPHDQGRAGGGASRPRPEPLRSPTPQHPGLVPTLPSAARPARASAAATAHAPATACARRSVLRTLSWLVSRQAMLLRPPTRRDGLLAAGASSGGGGGGGAALRPSPVRFASSER